MIFKLRATYAAVIFAFLLAGCLPVTTKSPVGSTAEFKDDPALVGLWQGKVNGGSDTATIAFLPTDKGLVAVLIGIPMSKGKVEAGGFYASYALKTAVLGRYRYINAQELMEDGKPAKGKEAEGSFPLLYSVQKNGPLILMLADEDAAKEAVKAGKITGELENASYGDVTITAQPAELDKFFASQAGAALFKKPFVVLHKVK